MSKQTVTTEQKKKQPSPLADQNAKVIESFLSRKLEWVKRAQTKAEPLNMSLNQFLLRELKSEQDYDLDAYNQLLNSTDKEGQHAAVRAIVGGKRQAEKEAEEERKRLGKKIKDEAKLSHMALRFNELCAAYEASPTDEIVRKFIDLVARLVAVRRMRFFYDLQLLRMQSSQRNKSYLRMFGLEDPYIDDISNTLSVLEDQQMRTIDRTMLGSPYAPIYSWLRDNHVGCGPLMAGSIIAEIGDCTRFRSISALWAYAGLAVVGNDPETGRGGGAQRRKAGEVANWNNQLKTKLIGVLAGCFVKAQSAYARSELAEDRARAMQIKTYNDYKTRLSTQNELVPMSERVYDSKGKEIFCYKEKVEIDAFDSAGNPVRVQANKLPRKAKSHINNMAIRYMMKMFLRDVVNKWRALEGHPPLVDYCEQYLRGGRPHGK